MKKTLRLTVQFFIITLFIIGTISFSKADVSAGEMTIRSIYVGRGDALLISSNGHYMLVDSGTTDGISLLMDYLSKQNIPNNKIDYVISTHPDGDHVGGFSAVFDAYDIGQVIYSPCTKASSVYTEFIKDVKQKGCPFKNPTDGDSWKLGDATVSVVYDGSQGSTYNECSIVLKVTCDGKSALLMGDLPSTMERQLMEKGYDFKADILKLGHHGAAASSCAAFLDAVKPEYAIVSCKKGSVFPKPSVLKRLARRFVKVYRNYDKDVVIQCKNGKISTSNKENNEYVSIKRGKITLSNNVFYANGKAIKPTASLYVNGVLVPASNYKIKYSSNTHTGFGKVKLTATNVKYVSTCSTTFMIRPAKLTLTATISKFNNIKLSWSKQSYATGYTIQYSTDKSFKKNVKTITTKKPEQVTRTLSNLSFNKTYYIRVRAYKSNIGNGKWSKKIKAKTLPAPIPAKQKITQVTPTSNGKIKLSWIKQSSKYSAKYRIQYSTDKKLKNTKTTKTLKIKKTSTISKTLKNLKKGTTYYFRIQGYNKYGNGKWSKVKSIKIQ